MDWDEYYDEWQASIDGADDRSSRYWALLLLLLMSGERTVRNKMRDAALAIRIRRGGFFADPAATRKFRTAAYTAAGEFGAWVNKTLGSIPRNADPRASLPAITGRNGAFAESMLRDEAHAMVVHLNKLRMAHGQPLLATPDLADEYEDTLFDMLLNISRNSAYERDRVVESAVRLSGPGSRRDTLLSWLLGNAKGGEEWHVNRNNMQLSTAEHTRAFHRRAAIAEGDRLGVQHYRMDVPTGAKFSPKGVMAEHVWRVRTKDEWADIVAKANAQRVAASSFDSFGLGFGDISYLIPVALVLLDDAREHGEEKRREMAEMEN